MCVAYAFLFIIAATYLLPWADAHSQDIVGKLPLEASQEGSGLGGGLGDGSGLLPQLPAQYLPYLPPSPTPQLLLNFKGGAAGEWWDIHKDIHSLVVCMCEHTLNVLDREKVYAMYRELVRSFFSLPSYFLYPHQTHTQSSAPYMPPKGETYPPGMQVWSIKRHLLYLVRVLLLSFRPIAIIRYLRFMGRGAC